MKNFYLGALTFGLWLAASTLALPLDPHLLKIDDTGKVLPKYRKHHAKKGDKISWLRQTGAKQSWYVKFPGESPCAEGKEFGDRRRLTCTVSVICDKVDDPACKSYYYQSGAERGGKMNDPEIIVEP